MENLHENIFSVREGELYIEDLKASALAEQFGTPLFVYSETLIRERFAEIKKEFLSKWSSPRWEQGAALGGDNGTVN